VFGDFLPNWAVFDFSFLEGSGSPFCLCLLYCFLNLGFSIAVVLLAFWRILARLVRGKFRGVWIPAIVLLFVALPVFMLLTGSLEGILLNYGLGRYDKSIKAIERYKAENDVYPESLDALVPDYLRSKPGVYLAFGQCLKYAPVTESDDSAPFKFELCGYIFEGGSVGHILKYCPIEFNCAGGRRVNDKWVWANSDLQGCRCKTDDGRQ
jgi:hypothetical protein